ncbi:9711_t:CDS:2, partial [Entrophospora sp. SA101]
LHTNVTSTIEAGTRCHSYITDCNGHVLVDDGMKDCSTDYGFCRVSSHDLPDGTTYCTHMIVQGHIGGNNRYIEASDTACFHLHGNVFHWTFDQIDCHHYCYPDPSFYVKLKQEETKCSIPKLSHVSSGRKTNACDQYTALQTYGKIDFDCSKELDNIFNYFNDSNTTPLNLTDEDISTGKLSLRAMKTYYFGLPKNYFYCTKNEAGVDEYYKYQNNTNTHTYNHHRYGNNNNNLTELCDYCTNTTIQNIEQYYITNPPTTSHLKQIVGDDFENGPEIPSDRCPQNTSNITSSSSSSYTSDAGIKLKNFKEIYLNFGILMILVFTGINFLN